MRQRACVGHDAAGRDGTLAQRPEELLVPLFTDFRCFHISQRTRHPAVGVVHGLIYRSAIFGSKAVFLVPDIQGSFLERNGIYVHRLQLNGSFHL